MDNSRIVDLLAAVAGRLGVKISQLPAIGSAPELVQEKAISIGVSFLALGTTRACGAGSARARRAVPSRKS